MPEKNAGPLSGMPRPKDEFINVPETEIWKSLESGQINPVLAEVTRLVAGYLIAFRAFAEQGLNPPLSPSQAQTPIEKVALLMAAAYVAQQRQENLEKVAVN